MNEYDVVHDTIVIHREYPAAPERIFRAWTTPALMERWYTPGDDGWSAKILDHDFRIGGSHRMTFGNAEESYTEECLYVDVVPERRFCYAMTIARGDERITTSMVTVELASTAGGCALRVTDQLAILSDGDSAAERERGWGETLDKLGPALADA